MADFEYIDSNDSLLQASAEWRGITEFGIDLECENNLHCYGKYISIIQISSREKHWIVDVLTVQNVDPLLDMLEDPKILKVFHDVNFDLRILHHQFNCKPRNIFDTKVATHFLGMESNGLKGLLQEFFGVETVKKFQMANWSKRPLSEEMLAYAIGDTRYLIALKDILYERLCEKGRMDWVTEEFRLIEGNGLCFEEQSFLNLRGAKTLTPKQRAILKRLLDVRERKAKKLNKPPFWVMRTSRLMELVTKPPGSVDEWKRIYGVHPIVKKNAHIFHNAVEKARREEIHLPVAKRYHYTARQHENARILTEMREELAAELAVEKSVILSKDQMQEVVLKGSMDCLRNWQKELLLNRYPKKIPVMFNS